MSAVKQDAERRTDDGLPLLHWHTVARCNVLRVTCPLDVRRLIAGQHNATGRLIRSTSLHELMTMVYKDDKAPDLHTRIMRSLERSGMNVDVAKPVCLDFMDVQCHFITLSSTGQHCAPVHSSEYFHPGLG